MTQRKNIKNHTCSLTSIARVIQYILLLFLTTSCAQSSSVHNTVRKDEINKSNYKKYYDNNDNSNEKLFLFGKTYPECPLWTDWRQACSRTGPTGAVLCVADRTHHVKASEPFCVRTEFSGLPSPMTDQQLASSSRFCKKKQTQDVADLSGAVRKQTSCQVYQENRPFNGRNIQARYHPQCNQWAREKSGIFSCSAWASKPCLITDGVPRNYTYDDSIVIPRKFDPEIYPIFGVFCI